MDPSATLSALLLAAASQPLVLVPMIVLATFVLEDVATVTVALLASQMVIDGGVAVTALVAGTILGDLAIYYAARKAAHLTVVARMLRGPTFGAVRDWLQSHALALVLLARFTPGLRLPIFAGAGSIGVPARSFAAVIILSTLIWTPGLFYAASAVGMAGIAQFSGYGWIVAAGSIAAVALAPRLVSALVARRSAALPA